MRWPVVLSLPLLGIIGLVTAETDEPGGPSVPAVPGSTRDAPPPPHQHPIPMAAVSEKNSSADRINQLGKAVEHLQAARLNSLADHTRGLSNNPSGAEPPPDRGKPRHSQASCGHDPGHEVRRDLCFVWSFAGCWQRGNRLGIDGHARVGRNRRTDSRLATVRPSAATVVPQVY